MMLFSLAEKLIPQLNFRIPLLVKYILSKELHHVAQIEKAIEYLKAKGDAELSDKEFEKHIGVLNITNKIYYIKIYIIQVGVIITEEDIRKQIRVALENVKEEALNERYKYNFLELLPEVKSKFPYLDGKLTKKLLDEEIEKLLGGKNESELLEIRNREDLEALKKKKKTLKDKFEETDLLNKLTDLIKTYDAETLNKKEISKKIKLSKVKTENKEEEEVVPEKDKLSSLMARDLKSSLNSESVLKKHLEFTKGKVFTRFPPEPNGYLHIGHAKAMRFNFNSAEQAKGFCYLRYDDTNPEKECKEFIDNIEENVRWLGYTPFKITHASDYFDEIYALAVELIKRGKAYVCHLNKEQVSEGRMNMIDSPYRNRSIEENLKLFDMMKQGRFDEKEVKFLIINFISVV